MIKTNLKQKAIDAYLDRLKGYNVNSDPYHWRGWYDPKNYMELPPKVYIIGGKPDSDLNENIENNSKTLVKAHKSLFKEGNR